MKYAIAIWLVLLIIVFRVFPAKAEDWSVKFGPSIQEGQPDGSAKAFGVRREEHLLRGVYSAVELGGYVDNGGNGRKGAGLAKLQLGSKPGPSTGLYGFAFFGPCGITATDTQLGSMLQFATDVGFGIRSYQETFVNVGYSHLSNAGIFSGPNKGRDFLTFSFGVSL